MHRKNWHFHTPSSNRHCEPANWMEQNKKPQKKKHKKALQLKIGKTINTSRRKIVSDEVENKKKKK